MAYLLDIQRRRHHYDALLHQIMRPERPLVERKNPFHIYGDDEFLHRYRFTKQTAVFITDELTPALQRHTSRADALPVYLQVLTALRFYAVGTFQLMHGDEATLSQASLSRIISDVSIQIAHLRPQYIQFPTTPLQIQQTQQSFFDYCQFPGVVGAIDCTHVHIRSPGGDNAQRFLNRKSRFSINVQAVCTHEGLIIDVVARWPGGSHDSRIFRESRLKRILQEASHEAKWLLGDSGWMRLTMNRTQLLPVAFLVLLSAICKARPADRTPHALSNTVYQVGTQTILDLVVDKLNRLQQEMDELKQQQIITLETREGTYSDATSIHRIVGPAPLDCHEVRRREPRAVSGVYMIKPRGQFDALPIYCEMDKEGYGWTVFQRRMDGSEDFNRHWRDYSRGFGNVSSEFWLGNEFLHHLTMQYNYILRVEVTDWFNRKYIADYSGFEVDSKRNDFRMTIEEFLGGNATDALTYHSGSKFTTTDKDNDDSEGVNCAVVHHGGWWFQACDRSNLNGLYYQDGTYGGEWDDGIEWKETDGPPFYSYKATKMMLRPWE